MIHSEFYKEISSWSKEKGYDKDRHRANFNMTGNVLGGGWLCIIVLDTRDQLTTPMHPIWPVGYLDMAQELRMVFTFLQLCYKGGERGGREEEETMNRGVCALQSPKHLLSGLLKACF